MPSIHHHHEHQYHHQQRYNLSVPTLPKKAAQWHVLESMLPPNMDDIVSA